MLKRIQKTLRPRGIDGVVTVPAGVPAYVTPELIASTIRVWQPLYSEPLTPIDALEMILNVGNLCVVPKTEPKIPRFRRSNDHIESPLQAKAAIWPFATTASRIRVGARLNLPKGVYSLLSCSSAHLDFPAFPGILRVLATTR